MYYTAFLCTYTEFQDILHVLCMQALAPSEKKSYQNSSQGQLDVDL